MKNLNRICLVPYAKSVGGPASFQRKFADGLEKRGIQVCHDLNDPPYDAVLVVGGTRHLAGLRRAKRKGIPIIQRLDGINWVHRVRSTGVRHYLKSEYGNFLLSFIRNRITNRIIYQSKFVHGWWERKFGPSPVPYKVIHNGVDLNTYSPDGPADRPSSTYRINLIEGGFGGGHDLGLTIAAQMASQLTRKHGLPVELLVAGKVSDSVRSEIETKTDVPIHWSGLVPGERIPYLNRSAHLYYSSDVNPACPNAVIEALACGLPVAAYDTGSLAELVGEDAGRVVPFGGDPWKLDKPDIPPLAAAAAEILQNQEPFQKKARSRAVENFGLEAMIDDYLSVIAGEDM